MGGGESPSASGLLHTLTLITLPSMVTVTPLGTVTGLLPIRLSRAKTESLLVLLAAAGRTAVKARCCPNILHTEAELQKPGPT